ncbi:TetR family transcriptional regulator [Cryptosporangium sp. NPDC051539]|uniref:TetR family transcriptional regulator n=1 Tax=Cryptosporangium sp. NPDC051539 TaxID=3363962 RepID=UPI0037BB75EE
MRGEGLGLAATVRAVTAHLSTGRGAIYHHVATKDDLLAAAADGVVETALATVGGEGIWTRAGALPHDLGIAGAARSDRGAALVSYVLGAAAQHASGARRVRDEAARAAGVDIFLAGITGR